MPFDPDLAAEDVVAMLGLAPHPEGGFYAETFRDAAPDDGRARSTAIYFLLRAGERSHWHRVDATEYWLWHAGGPLRISIADDGAPRTVSLGPHLAKGERPQVIVPAGAWQAAEAGPAWCLVTCIVAPGFEFSQFELAPPDWAPG